MFVLSINKYTKLKLSPLRGEMERGYDKPH
jgi:hypothetical protein